jgi:hypothetical protein
MRILIGTPAGGGQLTVPYFTSFMATFERILALNQSLKPEAQIQVGIYTLTHEALISRGRNHIAQVALQQGWDKLFFIDADAGWTPDQFLAVATAPVDIIAGTCPLKTYPISLNYLPFKDDEHYYQDAIRSVESLAAMRAGHASQLIKVPFVGTAFMCISGHVLRRLAEVAEPYQYPNPATGNLETHWDFFQTKPVKKMYMSEDWGFCHMARECGFDVYIHADVVITHTGAHTFRATLPAPRVEGEAEIIPTIPIGKITAVQSDQMELGTI